MATKKASKATTKAVKKGVAQPVKGKGKGKPKPKSKPGITQPMRKRKGTTTKPTAGPIPQPISRKKARGKVTKKVVVEKIGETEINGKVKVKYREEWLHLAIAALRPLFETVSITLPDTIRVSIGWPSRGALSARRRVIGECFHQHHSEDGTHQLYISPCLGTTVEVLETLVHEMLHTAFEPKVKHNKTFAKAAVALGLEGKPTATFAGGELRGKLEGIVEEIGAIPHSKLTATSKTKPQSTRLLKGECPGCGYVIRVTAKWAETGMPTCPCGTEMELADNGNGEGEEE